jgi:pimeloyl-ACP methyl ester carboxylesterase
MFGESAPEELKSHWMGRWKANETIGAAASMRSVTRREDISDRLSEIAVPALVIHGHQDVAIDISRAERLASGLSGLHEFVKLEGAGHSSTVEAPEEINQSIERFLKSVSG